MAERLYGIAAEFAGLTRQRARLRPLLRDRHDRPLARRPGRRGLGARERRRRRSPTPSATRAANGIENARFVAADARLGIAPAARAGRPARRRGRRSAARRPLEEDRPPGARVRGAADRLRLLQPDHAGPERGSARRGRLYAAAREAGRHVPADAARRVRGACSSRVEAEPRASGSPPGSTRRSPRRSRRAAPSSATPRCGRTTTRARWARDADGRSPTRPRRSSSASR